MPVLNSTNLISHANVHTATDQGDTNDSAIARILSSNLSDDQKRAIIDRLVEERQAMEPRLKELKSQLAAALANGLNNGEIEDLAAQLAAETEDHLRGES